MLAVALLVATFASIPTSIDYSLSLLVITPRPLYVVFLFLLCMHVLAMFTSIYLPAIAIFFLKKGSHIYRGILGLTIHLLSA